MNNDPLQNFAGAYQAPPVINPSSNHNLIRWLVVVTLVLFASLLGLLLLVLIGSETGPVALLVGMIFATLPVPIYVILILWLDRYEPEPVWMLATAFFWGALVAVFISYILNTASGGIVYALTNDIRMGRTFSLVISAPIVEECSKALILFILFFWKKDEFDGILDGIVYAGMVGLGFAMTENIQYYGKATLEQALTGTFILRGTMSPFSHPLFTSMTGIGLGWARQTTNSFVKWTMPVVGLALAITLHATWNGSVTFFGGLGFLVTYFIVMLPIMVATLVTVSFALYRESRIVRDHLMIDLQRGLFTPEEHRCQYIFFLRMSASLKALFQGGVGVWRLRMQFNQTASELAFHRSRVSRGIFKTQQAALEREAAYIQQLQDLRRRLGSH